MLQKLRQKKAFKTWPDWDLDVWWDYSQSEPWEIVLEGLQEMNDRERDVLRLVVLKLINEGHATGL